MRKILTVLTVYILMILFIGCAKNKPSVNPDDIGKNEATISDEKLRVSEFTLGPGDEVEITVWGVEDMDRKILIGEELRRGKASPSTAAAKGIFRNVEGSALDWLRVRS